MMSISGKRTWLLFFAAFWFSQPCTGQNLRDNESLEIAISSEYTGQALHHISGEVVLVDLIACIITISTRRGGEWSGFTETGTRFRGVKGFWDIEEKQAVEIAYFVRGNRNIAAAINQRLAPHDPSGL